MTEKPGVSPSETSPPFLAFVECAGCGEAFPVTSKRAHARAKWCSERCRKAQYSTPCVGCGAPTNGSDGHGPRASVRCSFCNGVRQGTLSGPVQRAKFAPYRAAIEQLWAEGRTCNEIAAAIGHTFNPGAYRAQGYDLPHRRTPEQVARIREGRWGNEIARKF